MKDLFGNALLDYQNGNFSEDIITSTNISGADVLPISYLFRDYKDMPKLEQKALKLVKGSVLDVGCGAGSHSLYLQKTGFQVKAIDTSQGAIKVTKKRGVLNAKVLNVLDETETFDTILLFMNGTGIFQELSQVLKYMSQLKSLLKKKRQIIIDSSDIKYMYQDEDGGYWMDTHSNYYGELDYYLSYKGEIEVPLKWLYLDFGTLNLSCEAIGLQCELVLNGEHFDYLARVF